jgi:hypothetical protein
MPRERSDAYRREHMQSPGFDLVLARPPVHFKIIWFSPRWLKVRLPTITTAFQMKILVIVSQIAFIHDPSPFTGGTGSQ